jgi:predicted Zn-dependent peptidase
MSSRLFQTIREDQGLAYSIFSEMSPYRDTGSLCVYAGVAVDKTKKVLQLTMDELRRLKEETVSEIELKRAKDQLKSNMVIGLESSGSRMANLARQQMYFGRFFGVSEIMEEIEAVSTADVQTLAQELFRPESIALALLGNLGTMEIEREDLAC